MKMRKLNHLMAIVTVLACILALIAVLTGEHTTFGVVSASVALAVSLGMYLRVVIGTAALQVADKQEELLYFSIAQKKDLAVVRQFSEWVKQNTQVFKGALMTDLVKAVDEDGNCNGFWVLLVGTRSQYNEIRKELGNSTTVLDFWPIDRDKWARKLLEELTKGEDFPEGDEVPTPELKG